MRNHLLALTFLTALASPCRALEIQLFEVGATPLSAAQLSAFKAAADRWESELADPITVRVNIGFADLGTSLGNTWVARTTHFLPVVRTALIVNSASSEELLRAQLLPSTGLQMFDINGQRGDGRVTMATANAKALGLSTGLDPFYGEALENQADAKLLFNNKFANGFDYDATDGIGQGSRDFTALAAREIGHALGFKSMTDIQDLPANAQHIVHPSTLDLFRFPQTQFTHNLTVEPRLVTAGPAEYFDKRMEKSLSWGRLATDPECDAPGDHCLASYWRDGGNDTMTPTLPRGVAVELSDADIQAFDAIGYQRPSGFDPRQVASIATLKVGWFDTEAPAPCVGCSLPAFPRGTFDEFEPAPEFSELPASLKGADFN
ncbi:MAG: NF038122 family metalloprotease, partial [Planctomycetia bacterium]|nr:NF038122 family metalloprotease [Planctomycetia bacterium]